MRPGPGLVVMALAFISGARRGTSQQHSSSAASSSNKLGKFEEDNTEALSRINPWLSACDLAQPNTAPDLQVSIRSLPSKNPFFSYPLPLDFFSPHQAYPFKKTQSSKQCVSPNCEPALRTASNPELPGSNPAAVAAQRKKVVPSKNPPKNTSHSSII